MKKILTIFTSLVLALNISGLAVSANTSKSGTNKNLENTMEIYVDENYVNQSNGNAAPRTRGTCTEVYSKAWCDSHGYQNNRPVGGKVLLNDRERRCYLGFLASGTHASITMLVTGPAGALVAAPLIAFNLFNCLL